MKLMTSQIEKKLRNTDFSSGHDMTSPVIVKYFNPYGVGTWLIVAGKQLPNGDWNLYGYNNLGEWEWGFVRLSELESIEVPMFHGKLERDRFINGTVVELCRIKA